MQFYMPLRIVNMLGVGTYESTHAWAELIRE